MKNIDFHKWTIYLGIFFSFSFGIVCILEQLNPQRMHFEFGILPNIILLVFFIFLAIFFRLALKFWKVQIVKKSDFKKLTLLGIFETLFPLFLFYQWIVELLKPAKQRAIEKLIMPYLRFALSVSEYTKDLKRLSNITLLGTSICIIMTLIFTYRLYSTNRKLGFDSSKSE